MHVVENEKRYWCIPIQKVERQVALVKKSR